MLDAQKQLLDAAVLAYRESLKLTQVRHDTGIASDQDVAQAETQLNITRAQATDLGIQRAQLEHAMATLLGKPASTFSIATNPLIAKPIAIPFGVPSQLLERRPDVAAAERRVAEANAQIGVARAAYFPTITLSGSAGYQSSSMGNLVSGPAALFGQWARRWRKHFLTLENAGPLPNRPGRTIRARSRTIARPCSPLFRKSKTIFRRCEFCRRNFSNRMPPLTSSQRYLTLAKDRYTFGIDSYLNVIIAQTTLLNNQRTAMNLRLQQMTASVQLIKALGGGWDVSHKTTATTS